METVPLLFIHVKFCSYKATFSNKTVCAGSHSCFISIQFSTSYFLFVFYYYLNFASNTHILFLVFPTREIHEVHSEFCISQSTEFLRELRQISVAL